MSKVPEVSFQYSVLLHWSLAFACQIHTRNSVHDTLLDIDARLVLFLVLHFRSRNRYWRMTSTALVNSARTPPLSQWMLSYRRLRSTFLPDLVQRRSPIT